MTVLPSSVRSRIRLAHAIVLACVACTLGGCNFIHNFGSGTHLDAPPDKPANTHAAHAGTIRAEVVTDAAGQVVAVTFLRSSGSNAVDNYVADSIRTGWPGGPSTRSVVELNYKPGGGFTDPKVLSATPVP